MESSSSDDDLFDVEVVDTTYQQHSPQRLDSGSVQGGTVRPSCPAARRGWDQLTLTTQLAVGKPEQLQRHSPAIDFTYHAQQTLTETQEPCNSPTVNYCPQQTLTARQAYDGNRPEQLGTQHAGPDASSSDSEIDSEDEDVAALFRAERSSRDHCDQPASAQLSAASSGLGVSCAAMPRPAETGPTAALDLAQALHGLGSGVLKRKCPAPLEATDSHEMRDSRLSQDCRRRDGPQPQPQPQPQQQQPQPQPQPQPQQDQRCGQHEQQNAKKHGRDDAQSPRKKPRLSPRLPPQPFRLVMTKGISTQANAGCPRLRSLLNLDDMVDAVLSNYMYDFTWLRRECPYLNQLRRMTIIHHARNSAESAETEASKPSNAVLHAPNLPVPYGTMHSKCALVFSPTQLRLMITTANYICIDWENKTQAVWFQDFPLKAPSDYDCGRSSGEFEDSLVEYFEAVGGFDVAALRKFNFSSARGRLVASVPGYHTGDAINKWGHMRLRSLLRDVAVAPRFDSMVTEKWIRQNWLPSVSSCRPTGGASQCPPKLQLVIPTETEVQNSVEGWAAGQAIPIQRNKHKSFMREWNEPTAFTEHGFAVSYGRTVDLYHRWSSKNSAALVRPSMFTFSARRLDKFKEVWGSSNSNGQQPIELAWVVVSSHNFGPSPWGELQKAQTQLMIRSYELGILVTPETELAAQVAMGAEDVSLVRLLQGVAVPPASVGDGAAHRCAGEAVSWIPLPYELPPAPFCPQDIPWAVDDTQHRPDCLGNIYVPGQPLMIHGPPVHDRGATGHGYTAQGGLRVSSLHDQQYRQQQLQRQRQQTLRQQQNAQGIVTPSHGSQRSTHSSQDDGVSNAASIGSATGLAGGSSSARWCWKAGAGWQPYDSKTTAVLEQSHSQFFACKHNGTDPAPFVKVDVGGGRHVNLRAMLQVVTATPGRTRHVRRCGPPPPAYAGGDGADGTTIHLRDTWV